MASEIIIHEGNWQQFVQDPIVNGQQKLRGLIPRDYTKHPAGCYATGKTLAVEMPLIPRSEWDARITDKIAQKSQISDIRMAGNNGQPIPSLDQNGKGYSHTEDTEVLTDRGWVRWPDYNWKDSLGSINPLTHLLEFQTPTEGHAYEYDDEMYHSLNRRVDFGVTRNHRMLVRKFDQRRRTLSDNYTFQRADELGWYVGLMHAPTGFIGTEIVELEVPGDRRYDGDDFLAMVAMISSCGYAGGSDSTWDRTSFCCFDEKRYHQVAALAKRVGFSEQPSRKGVWTVYRKGLADWFRANGYVGGPYRSPFKKVPDIVKWVSVRQIKHFLSWFGDKNNGENAQSVYYSASRRMIDDLQELWLRVGKRSTIEYRGPSTAIMEDGKVIESKESYVLCVGEVDRLCLDRKKHIVTDHYKGLVYCATVPNGTLVTRRNGKVLISGNCWAHSSTSAMMMARAVANQPYVALSAYAIACIIKNFQDQGGWGAESMDFITSRGVPSDKFWPMQSMDRANDNPNTWANAAQHKLQAGWIDLASAQYDRNLTFDQVGTLLLSDVPVVCDYNWWSHSVCGIDLVSGSGQRGTTRDPISGKLVSLQEYDRVWGMNDPVTAGYGVRILNSWGDSWSDHGMGVITSDKAVPDGSVAPRVITASPI